MRLALATCGPPHTTHRLADDIVEIDTLVDRDAGPASFGLDSLRHRKRAGRDKVDINAVEREKLDEAVNSPAVLEVTD